MKLCTECHWDGWDRVVDIYPERSDKLPEYINDPENYKVIILEKGSLEIKSEGQTRVVKAPALIGLSQKDVLDYKILQGIKVCILFFSCKWLWSYFKELLPYIVPNNVLCIYVR